MATPPGYWRRDKGTDLVKTNAKKSLLSSGTYLQTLAVAGTAVALLSSTNAFAQDAADDEEADDQTIVVTGTLIRNPNLEQANPVNATTADTIELKNSNTAEEVLREVPGIVPNIGSAVNNGNGGSSYVDLRGLGSNRNIVLLDGNRITPADLQGRVDLNNIPLALISRVDALTGAAVTTYGADAITGVINFITKDDFAGVDLSIGNHITEDGDGHYLRTDLTVGANFDDGRGNAVLSVGYQESDPVYQGGRDFSTFGIDSFSGTLGGSGTTVPARITGTRPLLAGVPDTNPLTPNGGTRQVNPATGAAVGSFFFFNFNPYNIFQTPFKRYNIFAQANYEVSDAVEVYTRGLFSKNTVDTIIAPSGSFGGSVTMNLNNPYMPATLASQFCAFDTDPGAAYTPLYSPAVCAAARTATGVSDPNYRTVTFNLSRRATEVGPRISNYTTTIFDYRVGLRGDLSSSVSWDLSGAYGESEKVQAIKNYTLQSRWRQGLLANNTTNCHNAANNCVPVNPFGPDGSITPGMADFLSEDSTTVIRTSLAQVRGVISGDLGFASPGAVEPIGFAIGGEYRKYRAQQASDLLAKTPGELGGAGGAAPDIDGGYDVYEAYAEVIAPLIEDAPAFHSLTLEGGARYSRYRVEGGGTNSTWTYKVGMSWEPTPDIKFRGNYSHAVRAPNIAELFTPQTVGLTNLAVDPCAGAVPVTNTNLRNICLAQGAPLGTIGSILNPTAAQANITVGGNLNLGPETANTWTVGAVFQPQFLPGLSLTVDYYNIKVDSVVGAPLPGDLMSACFGAGPYTAASVYSATAASSAACTVIRRNPVTGGLDGDPATTFGLFAPLDNQGKLFTDGIDLIANYQNDIGFAEWSSSFVLNWTNSSKFQATPTGLNRECANFYSINCSFTGSIQPTWQWSWRNTFTFDKIDFSVLWRHINAVEREPQDILDNGVGFSGDVVTPVGTFFVNADSIPSYDYFDLTLRFNVTDNLSFTAAVRNLFDKKPPVVGSTIGTTTYNSGNTFPSTYDALGRDFSVAVRLKF